ncbi:MAG: toll/interleukin-1 receptor domain-containing protein [Nitrospiria bacterium]
MKIFISHAHGERRLAAAWKTLFEDLGASIDAWYSSDRNPGGGMASGAWREKVEQALREADMVLGLYTPESKEKPWLYFECAYAMGMEKKNAVIPIVYYMEKRELPSPLQNIQIYLGDNRDSLKRLYGVLIDRYGGKHVKEKIIDVALDDYFEKVETHNQKRLGKSLFHGHFHEVGTAKKMEGEWFAKWTQFPADGKPGKEQVFETHPMKIWTTKERLRLVGKGKDWADYYPMEGVVSAKGYVALSYWRSQGEIPICGTALLELIGGNRIMEGIWEGYTGKTLRERLALVKGRVVIARDEVEVRDYWGLEVDPGNETVA